MATLTNSNVHLSLIHYVCSNVKHKTKENAPGQTAAQLYPTIEYRERRHGRLNVHSRLSQSDYCDYLLDGKVPFLKHSLTFFLTHSQNIRTYIEKIVEYCYTISLLLESSGTEL